MSDLFPEFVEPADRCDCCRIGRKQYRVQLTLRNVKIDTMEFLIADLCAECCARTRAAMPSFNRMVVP